LRRISPFVVYLALLSGCGAHPTAAYSDGHSHGNEAFQAQPLVRENGRPAAAARFHKACVELADFYAVPQPKREDWLTGCIDGARAMFK
jgi:hypothetical protein